MTWQAGRWRSQYPVRSTDNRDAQTIEIIF